MTDNTNYVKRTQKDYTLSFKLQVVKEIESGQLGSTEAQRKYGIQGDSTIKKWLRKYGNFDWENQTPSNMSKTPEQKNHGTGSQSQAFRKTESTIGASASYFRLQSYYF